MKFCRYINMITLMALLFSSYSFAQNDGALFHLKFKHSSNIAIENSQSIKLKKTDVTLAYPWETQTVNFDLGLSVRHWSAINEAGSAAAESKSLPLFYASALFNTPLKGLSAGFEGNHFGLKRRTVYDYKAKVSYEWKNGLGMQGGWQHQQLGLDNTADLSSDYLRQGAFLDVYLNF